MPAGKTFLHKRSKLQRVVVVKPKRKKRRGPKLTRLLKNKNHAKLRYATAIAIDSGTTIASHTFSANGIFDPDITGTGHQPLLRDEYNLLYLHYRVLSSKIKITPYTGTTTSTVPALYGVFVDPGNDGTLTYVEGTAIVEDRRVNRSWSIMNTSADIFHANKVLSTSYSNRMVNPELRDNATLMSANPSGTGNSKFFQVWCASPDGVINPGIVKFIVEIEYLVEFTTPVNLTQS